MHRVILAFAGVLGLWVLTGCVDATADGPAAPRDRWQAEVEGFGDTAAGARRAARVNAVKRMLEVLRTEQAGGPFADVTLDASTQQRLLGYAEKFVIAGEGHAGKDVQIDVNRFKVWVLPLHEEPDWASVVRLEQSHQRDLRAGERQTLAARVMALLFVLVAAGFAYVRLDQWTRGRYTSWLRAGAVAAAGALGAGWWLS